MQQDVPVTKNVEDARQGRSGVGLRWVLRISIVLVVVAFAAIWMWG
jgi:hypothetical protein